MSSNFFAQNCEAILPRPSQMCRRHFRALCCWQAPPNPSFVFRLSSAFVPPLRPVSLGFRGVALAGDLHASGQIGLLLHRVGNTSRTSSEPSPGVYFGITRTTIHVFTRNHQRKWNSLGNISLVSCHGGTFDLTVVVDPINVEATASCADKSSFVHRHDSSPTLSAKHKLSWAAMVQSGFSHAGESALSLVVRGPQAPGERVASICIRSVVLASLLGTYDEPAVLGPSPYLFPAYGPRQQLGQRHQKMLEDGFLDVTLPPFCEWRHLAVEFYQCPYHEILASHRPITS